MKVIKIFVLCILAAAMNILVSFFFMAYLEFPLFLDTVFTAAIAFSFGLFPGLFVGVLGWLAVNIYYGAINIYLPCIIIGV